MNPVISESSGTAKGVIAGLTGFLFLALTGICVKFEFKYGATAEWIILIQYLTGLIIILIIASRNNFKDLRTSNLKFQFIRGITGILAFTCYVTAISRIPIVNASLLNNSAPLFIPIVTLIWLKNKIDEKIWWGIIVGFTGIVFILDPSAGDLIKKGDLYGIASGILLAVSYVALGELTKTENFISILFYYTLSGIILSLPFAIFNFNVPPLIVWIYGISAGLLFISYLYLIQFAYRYVKAVQLAPLNFSVVVFMGILDWLIFDNVPGLFSLIGIVLVSFGGILAISLHEKDNKDLKHHWH